MITRQFVFSDARVTTRDDTTSRTAIKIKGATINFDASWSPYGQISLTCQPPSDTATLDKLEPRADRRLRFRLTQTNQDNSTAVRDFDVQLRTRTQQWRTAEMTLAGTTDEQMLQEYVDSADNGLQSINYPTSQLVAWSVGLVTGTTVDQRPDAPSVSVQWDTDAPWKAGISAWDYAGQLAEAAGAWLYVDETGIPHYAAPGWAAYSTRLVLDGTMVLDVADTVSRDDPSWGTDAIVTYTGNTPPAMVATTSGIVPRKVISLSRNRRKPGGNAATSIAATARKRGRNLTVTSIADIRTRPNQPVTVTWRGQTRSGTVQNVAFDLPAGLMTVQVNVIES